MRKAATAAALCLTLAVVLGCETLRSRNADERLHVAKDPVISDLPVPQSAQTVGSSSYFKVNPGSKTRVVFMTYRVRTSVPKLLAFFRENMPISGWKLLNESCDFGQYVLKFTKGNEVAAVEIEEKGRTLEFTISLDTRTPAPE